jgi:hypothetical protein
MADHPGVVAEAAREHPRSRTSERRYDGLTIVTYGATRVHLDRGAWEMLPADGVLLMRVRPSDSPAFALAFTAQELAAVFGEVRVTKSWNTVRCYHFPKPPPAVSSFRVAASAPVRSDADADQATETRREDPAAPEGHWTAPAVGPGNAATDAEVRRDVIVPRALDLSAGRGAMKSTPSISCRG